MGGNGLFAQGQPVGQALGQSSIQYLGLGFLEIILQPAQLDCPGLEVVDGVSGTGIPGPGLAHAADVDEILFALLDRQLVVLAAGNRVVLADKSQRHMGVAEKTDARILVGEAGCCVEFAHHVAPALGGIQRGMHNGEVGNHAQVLQPLEPVALFVAQLVACPHDGVAGVRVEPTQVGVSGAILVVVAHDARHPHVAHNLHALLGIRVVANHVAQAHVTCAVVFLCILQHHLECLKVGVDITEKSDFHVTMTCKIKV